VATRTLLVAVGHVDLDALARQIRRQWTTARRPSARMSTHGHITGIHLDRLGHGPRLVGELLERELQLPGIHALGLFAKQPLTEHIELMPQRGDLALGFVS
jgi:hypothetical protein